MCALYNGIEIPDNDAERVKAVQSYEILDTGQELVFDDITELAACLTGCKASYIGFFDDKRLWLKSKYGLPEDLTERPRELTLCSRTICQSDLMIVPDMQKDPRYAELPSVKNPPYAKFYCAMPLINPEGFALGTLCVWDSDMMELEPQVQQCMRRLARQILSRLELRRKIIELNRQKQQLQEALETEQTNGTRNENLVRNLYPNSVAQQLIDGRHVEPQFFLSATIMFIDFHSFTTIAESTEPGILVDQLGDYFAVFDKIVDKHGLEKIKTIGDGYLAASGLPNETTDHAERVCRAALEIQQTMAKRNAEREKLGFVPWPFRIGVHSGSVIGGIVGTNKTTYDIWGDAVNVAARLQENCDPGQINVSEATVGLIGGNFNLSPRGQIEAKNKGLVKMYYLTD